MFVHVILENADHRELVELSDRLVMGTIEAAQAGNESAMAHLRAYSVTHPPSKGSFVELFSPGVRWDTNYPLYVWEPDR